MKNNKMTKKTPKMGRSKSFSLTEAQRKFVEDQAAQWHHSNESDYIQWLIERDKERTELRLPRDPVLANAELVKQLELILARHADEMRKVQRPNGPKPI